MRLYPRMVLDYGARDLLRLLRPGQGNPSGELAVIDRRLAQGRPFGVALSVRTALDLLISALDFQPGDEMVLSAVTVPGMAEIARSHGLVVRVADIDPEKLTIAPDSLKAVISDRTRLVVAAPLFGSHGDLAEVADLCRAAGILLVEDAAQAWDGTYRGSDQADVVLFSFGPAKTATALAGCVALFRDAALARRFRQLEAALPPQSPGWLAYRVVKFFAVRLFRGPRRLGLVAHGAHVLGLDPDTFIGSMAKGFAGPGLLKRIRRRVPASVRGLIAHRLDTHPGAGARKARARGFVARIDPRLAVPGRGLPETSFWLLPVCVADPAQLVAAFRAEGFDASRGASSLQAIVDDITGRPGDNARVMMDSLVYIPLTRYTDATVQKQMADIINRLGEPAARRAEMAA